MPKWMEFRSNGWIHTSIWEEKLLAHPSSPSPSWMTLLYFPNDWPESDLLVSILYLHLSSMSIGGMRQSRLTSMLSLLYPQKSLWDPGFIFHIQSLKKHSLNAQFALRKWKESAPFPHPPWLNTFWSLCHFSISSFLFPLKTNGSQHPQQREETF